MARKSKDEEVEDWREAHLRARDELLERYGIRPKKYYHLKYDNKTGELIEYQEADSSPLFVKENNKWVEYKEKPVEIVKKRTRKAVTESARELIIKAIERGSKKGKRPNLTKIAKDFGYSVATISKIKKEME